MKFIDSIDIYIASGKGGDGLFSFYNNNFSSKKIPDGGNGGRGGNVYFIGNKNLNNFSKLNFKLKYKASDGLCGKKNFKTGKNGHNLLIHIPLGTNVYDNERNTFVYEILKHNETFLIAKGGLPGFGNFFLRGYNNLDNKIKFGKNGELKYLRLELNLLADVGLLGFPNVGKSLLINSISNVFSKTENYFFTTINPILGSLNNNFYKNIIISDMPGIIKNSSKGMGLGFKFLKHLSKTKILFHIIDLSNINNKNDFFNNIYIINKELNLFDLHTTAKKKWLILNKVDLIINFNFNFILQTICNRFNYQCIFLISSKYKIGLKKLCFNIHESFKKNMEKLNV